MYAVLINDSNIDLYIRYPKDIPVLSDRLQLDFYLEFDEPKPTDDYSVHAFPRGAIVGRKVPESCILDIFLHAPTGYIINYDQGEYALPTGEKYPAIKLNGILPATPVN